MSLSVNIMKHGKHFAIDEVSGDKICSCGCGQVLESRLQSEDNFVSKQIDSDSLHKNQQNQPTISRRHDLGLGSQINPHENKDFAGKKISQENKTITERISKWQIRVNRTNASDRRLAVILDRFNNINEILNLSNPIANDVVYYLKKLEKIHILSHKKPDLVLIVLVSIVTKQHNIIIPKREFLRIYSYKPALFMKYLNDFVEALKIEQKTLVPNASNCVVSISKKLSLSDKIRDGAFEILTNCTKEKLHLSSGMAAAAAAIYVSGINLDLSNHLGLQDIAEVSGITCVTIRNYKEKMSPILNKMNLTPTVGKSMRFYKENKS